MSEKLPLEHHLPSQIFARWEGDDDPFLNSSEKEADLAERDEAYIGVYVLKEIHATKLITTTRAVSKKVRA